MVDIYDEKDPPPRIAAYGLEALLCMPRIFNGDGKIVRKNHDCIRKRDPGLSNICLRLLGSHSVPIVIIICTFVHTDNGSVPWG